MPLPTLAVRSRRVATPEALRPATVVVGADGRIAALVAWGEPPAGVPLDDCGEAVVMPGLVDTHVHVNEPGAHRLGGVRAPRPARRRPAA